MIPIGLRGVGKTVLLNRFAELAEEAGLRASYLEAPESGDFASLLAGQLRKILLGLDVRDAGVTYTRQAIDHILEQTQGYPYFLQEWGYEVWNVAAHSPIDAATVERAAPLVRSKLDSNFFLVRMDRTTPAEKLYLGAMAALGAGPHRSGDIAHQLGLRVESVAPRRSALITKGMIYSPAHGDTAFTVPLFDDFLRRHAP